MIRNYLKIAWRNLMKNKVFSLINILGLTIGITTCLMISLFIMNEFSFDSFHKNGKNIYRVMRNFTRDGEVSKVPYTSGPYAGALENDFDSEIKRSVRVDADNALISFGDKAFNEKHVAAVDTDFFKMFTFPLLRGNATTALTNPNSIVLTESTAKKYFGSVDNAMNKVVQIDKDQSLKVTAVMKDFPPNSHLNFDLLFPISNYDSYEQFHRWMNNGLFTYVELNDNTNKANLEKKFPAFIEKYMGEDMRRSGIKPTLSLTPLTDIYFEPTMHFDSRRQGDKTVVYIFFSIALLILLIACINFTNLSTIRAVERSKEVGLRKVLGALRNHLVWQFIGESLLLTAISCLLSLGLLKLLMPMYDQFLGYDLSFFGNLGYICLFLLAIIILVGVLAGAYPALILSAFSPIQALKGKLRLGKGGSFFRQALVVVQFSISVFLVIGTVTIIKQMNFVKNKQLGYQQEQAVVIPFDNVDIFRSRDLFKQRLETNNSIASVSLMSGEPGGFFDGYTFEAEGQNEPLMARTEFTDFDYVKTLGLKIIAGRNFSKQYGTDSTDAVLINHTAAKKLGFTPDQAIGKWIKNMMKDSTRRRIAGVVEDFNFESLKQEVEPLVITPGSDRRLALVRLKPGNITSAIDFITSEFSKLAPVYPMQYNFLDEKFGQLYEADLKQQKLLILFAGLAIFIACLGLFGLASFTTAKRTKEIGVRKVIGSTTKNIVLLLSRDLLKPVLVASFIAIPAGYYFMHTWLQNFAYRTELNWWIFLLAAGITIFIALATVGIKALKAAVANPVKSLRSE